MGRLYEDSESLRRIIEPKGFDLIDVTLSEGRKYPFTWDEMNAMPVTEVFEIGRNYFFCPRPVRGQTRRDAYSVTKGIGPAIVVEDLADHEDMDGMTQFRNSDRIIYTFTRLMFEDQYLLAITPQTIEFPGMVLPHLIIPYRSVVSKFEKLFRIITPEDIGADSQKIRDMKCMPTPRSDPESN